MRKSKKKSYDFLFSNQSHTGQKTKRDELKMKRTKTHKPRERRQRSVIDASSFLTDTCSWFKFRFIHGALCVFFYFLICDSFLHLCCTDRWNHTQNTHCAHTNVSNFSYGPQAAVYSLYYTCQKLNWRSAFIRHKWQSVRFRLEIL